MKSSSYRSAGVFAFTLLALGMVPAVDGQTPPILTLSDGDGNIVSVDSTGAVTYGGNCVVPTTCSTTSVFIASGQVSWLGKIGVFNKLQSDSGVTKPAAGSLVMDLNIKQVTTTAPGTITIKWTDTGFTPAPVTGVVAVGGTISGTGTVNFAAYMDNSNAPFGTGTTVVTAGPYSTPTFAENLTGGGASSAPFSMTEVVSLTMGAGSSIGGDFNLTATPAACTGTIGDFVWNDLNGDGIQQPNEVGLNGITVQLYKGAVVPGNLVATTTTGNAPASYNPAPGIGPQAGAPGYYQFTGLCQGTYNVVVDSSQPNLQG